jgi:hypothetical protein
VFTARYALSSYTKRTRLVLKGLMLKQEVCRVFVSRGLKKIFGPAGS